MAKSSYFSNFYHILEWIMWLLYLNLLWVLFSIIGLGVFGVFPATVSLFTIIRQLLQEKQSTIFKNFFHTFKQEFFRANVVGFVLALIFYLLYIDFLFLDRIPSALFKVFQIGLIVISTIFVITVLYIFPVYVHYDLKFFEKFKHAMLIGLFSPLANIMIVAGSFILFYIYKWMPGLIPVFGISLIALLLMFAGLFAFNRFQKKQEKYSEPEETDE